MDKIRPRLEAFAAEMLGSLARRERRERQAKGELNVRGLMLDGKRKSTQPMAQRQGVDHQQLQQFISSSTWDYVEARHRIARWAAARIAPEAYAIDDTSLPKAGARHWRWRTRSCRMSCWQSVPGSASPHTPMSGGTCGMPMKV